ncbi:hypothetical protein [Rhodococcus gannanensis]|uniref:DUF1214 domain-containing protein n=1 Tax=Rhodococcus gannanensis TaxID=1960308 RepID=A0ABW4NXX3_9NOCA
MTTVDTEESTRLATAWNDLAEQIRAFGESAMSTGDSLDQAEGLRHTLRFLGHLADNHIEKSDPLRPEFWRVTSTTRKYYGDGVDVDYDSCRIDGSLTYRISGTVGTVPYLAFIVNRKGASDRFAGNIVIDDKHMRADGTFEVWLSPDLAGRHGIELDDRCVEVVARQYHKTRSEEEQARFTIELVGQQVAARPPLDTGDLANSVARIAHGLGVTKVRLEALVASLAARPNAVAELSGEAAAQFFGTTSNHYKMGWFSLEDGESLELRFPAVEGRYFGVQLFNRWFESLEFRDHVTSINDHHVVKESDGSIVFHVGGSPELTNYLDTCGHREGFVLARYLEGAENPENPVARVVNVSQA